MCHCLPTDLLFGSHPMSELHRTKHPSPLSTGSCFGPRESHRRVTHERPPQTQGVGLEELVGECSDMFCMALRNKSVEMPVIVVRIISRPHEGAPQRVTPASVSHPNTGVALAEVCLEATHGRPNPATTKVWTLVVNAEMPQRVVDVIGLATLRPQYSKQCGGCSATQSYALCTRLDRWRSRQLHMVLLRGIVPQPNQITNSVTPRLIAQLHNIPHQLVVIGVFGSGGGRLIPLPSCTR